MPNPNVEVSIVAGFVPPLDRPPEVLLRAEGGLAVELEGGRRVGLDPGDPRSAGLAQFLDDLGKARRAVCLEVDPETAYPSRWFVPQVMQVVAVGPEEDDALRVELMPSDGPHFLRRETPEFDELERRLREAARTHETVLLTADYFNGIVDVRPDITPPREGPAPDSLPVLLSCRPRLLRIPWWLHGILFADPLQRAEQIFEAMAGTSCNPFNVAGYAPPNPPACIPFLYPDNGCEARAHDMCRRMHHLGARPYKVWLKGNLWTRSRRVPAPMCGAVFDFHVAPCLCVRDGFLRFRRLVIDPALFTGPVPLETWVGQLHGANAQLFITESCVYMPAKLVSPYTFPRPPHYDPRLVATSETIWNYRWRLRSRSLQYGPPPYADCP
jgi:Glutaminase